MDILHLHYFLAVAHHKSFTKAAQALHISQPSISKSIRSLEDEWNVHLFHRHSRDIELTDVGEALLPKISAIVSQFQQLNQQMLDQAGMQHGHLKMGIPPMVGSSFLSTLLSEFHRRYPQIGISVEEWGSMRIAENVKTGDLQVGYITLPIKDVPTNNYVFHSEPLKIVLPSGHHLSYATELSLEDIKNESFAFFSEEFALSEAIMNAFHNSGIKPHIVCKSLNWDFITEMVRADLGITLLPSSICSRLNMHEFRVVPISPSIHWRVAMIWSHDVFISTPSHLWLSYFKEEMPQITVDTQDIQENQ